jgi:hypothetical protein
MKQLSVIIVFIYAMFMSSCSNKPDNIIHTTKTEQGNWVVETPGQNPVMKYDTYYQISPTWSQANYYASKRADHILYMVLGSLFLLIFIILFYGRSSDASWFPKNLYDNNILFNALLFITLVSSISFFTSHQSAIKWNNDKWIKKEVYDKAIKETGSTQPIWDSLETNKLIVDGPY